MTQPSIPLTEFARRLCIAAHPAFGTTGNPVPCGTHVRDAQRHWDLVTDEGSKALGVILDIRRAEGMQYRFPRLKRARGAEPGRNPGA